MHGAVTGYKDATQLPGCILNTSHLLCSVDYTPPPPTTTTEAPSKAAPKSTSNSAALYHNVTVQCGGATDTLRLLTTEKTVEIRMYSDWNMLEVFFQKGRVAITVMTTMPQFQQQGLDDAADVALTSTLDVTVSSLDVYPMKGIWSTPDQIKAAPRVYPWNPTTAA